MYTQFSLSLSLSISIYIYKNKHCSNIVTHSYFLEPSDAAAPRGTRPSTRRARPRIMLNAILPCCVML